MLDIPFDKHASRIQRRIDHLATVTDEKGKLSRTFLSSAMEHANHLVAGWMRGAGLETSEDSVGNLFGQSRSSDAPIFLLGSHLDTVRDAGRFDGPLGVILGIEAVEVVRAADINLPFSLAVAGFTDEEGVRFQSAYTGSKAFCGLLTPQELVKVDREGQTMLEVIEQRCGHKFSLPGPRGYDRVSSVLGVAVSSFDLLFRGGTLVTAEAVASADVAVVEGRVVATGPELEGEATEIVDATGMHLFPGFIDAHVHFNEPGREHWEGLESGSRSLAAGGGTLFFEMPLNA